MQDVTKRNKTGDRALNLEKCFLWKHFSKLSALSPVLFLFVTSCMQQMAEQPRYDPLQASEFFPNGASARLLPVGVISHDYAGDESRDTGIANGKPVDTIPFTIDHDFMLRGQ